MNRRLALALSLALSLALALPLAARADDASHRAKAVEMMNLLHAQRMVQQISANITKQVTDAADSVAGSNPTPDTKAKVTDFEKKAGQLIDDQLGWDSMKAGFTEVYVKNFTEDQLDGIIAFYKTPAGTALLDKMPTVNSQITQFGTSRMSILQPQLKQLFDDFRKSQATVALPSSAAPPIVNIPPAKSAAPVAPK